MEPNQTGVGDRLLTGPDVMIDFRRNRSSQQTCKHEEPFGNGLQIQTSWEVTRVSVGRAEAAQRRAKVTEEINFTYSDSIAVLML